MNAPPEIYEFIPELCNEIVQLQQQGLSENIAIETAAANLLRRLNERNRQRADQAARDLMYAPNPYLAPNPFFPNAFGR